MSQLNSFINQDGVEHAIGISVDKKFGHRTAMWYFDQNKRTYLREDELIHIRMLPPKGTAPKTMVWSYKEFAHAYQVQVSALGNKVDRVFYGAEVGEVKRHVIFWLSKQWKVHIAELNTFLKNHPDNFKIKQLT